MEPSLTERTVLSVQQGEALQAEAGGVEAVTTGRHHGGLLHKQHLASPHPPASHQAAP